jgi:molybdenum cofactor synthesis domain-containing protein
MTTVAVLTVSDSCAAGRREDGSGAVLAEMLSRAGFDVSERRIVPDDAGGIAAELCRLADQPGIDLILTTGGTGLGPRDVTPEATASCCARMVPGIPEVMRSESFRTTARTALSRGVAGIRGHTLIINLPGSPRAIRECLEVILDMLPHAIAMMRGGGH